MSDSVRGFYNFKFFCLRFVAQYLVIRILRAPDVVTQSPKEISKNKNYSTYFSILLGTCVTILLILASIIIIWFHNTEEYDARVIRKFRMKEKDDIKFHSGLNFTNLYFTDKLDEIYETNLELVSIETS